MKEGLFKAQQEMIDGARHEAVRSGGVTPTYEEYLDWFRDETWKAQAWPMPSRSTSRRYVRTAPHSRTLTRSRTW